MHRYIPNCILKRPAGTMNSSPMEGVVLSIDITGFTRATQELMKRGIEGAEVVSNYLNDFLQFAIQNLKRYNGFILNFTGDGFVGFLPKQENLHVHALYIANSIRNYFAEHHTWDIYDSHFVIRIKIGVSYGKIQWFIIEDEAKPFFYFKGNAITEGLFCTDRSKNNKIIASKSFIEGLPEEDYVQIEPSVFIVRSKLKYISDEIPYTSVPNAYEHLNEFRNVASVFIALNENHRLEEIFSGIKENTDIYRGFINKVVHTEKGYDVMVLFGAPIGVEKPLFNALDFALNIREIIEGFTIGISYGMAFSGFIGFQKDMEYTVLSKNVNTSANIAHSEAWEQILLDTELTGQLSTRYSYQDLAIYTRIVAKKQSILEPQFTNAFFGREEIIETVQKQLYRTDFRAGNIVFEGNTGIGKSRLVYELRKINGSDVYWLPLYCSEFDRSSYYSIKLFLKRLFNLHPLNTKPQNTRNFEKAFDVFIENSEHDSFRTLMKTHKIFFQTFLDIPVYKKQFQTIHFDDTSVIFQNIIFELSKIKPVIIQLEDAQWCDAKTKEIIHNVIKTDALLPISTISTVRPNMIPNDLFSEKDITTYSLSPLPETHAEKMIQDLLEEQIEKHDLVELINKKCAGHPLFIEQLISYFFEAKKVKDFFTDDIPDTIIPVIVARIDQLPTQIKRMLKVAAVIGNTFSVKLLQYVLEDIPVMQLLKEGYQLKIWRKIDNDHYEFFHGLLRETVYNMQLKQGLRETHKKIAESILVVFQQNIKTMYRTIAQHYEVAERKFDAIHYYTMAGDYYSFLGQYSDSCDSYDDALNLINDRTATYYKIYEKYYRCVLDNGVYFHIHSELRKFIYKATDFYGRNSKAIIPVYILYANFLIRNSCTLKAFTYLKKAEALIQEFDEQDPEIVSELYLRFSTKYVDNSNWKESTKYLKKAFAALPEENKFLLKRSFILLDLSAGYRYLHQFDEAQKLMKEARKNYRQMLPSKHPKIASLYKRVGTTYFEQGNCERARRFLLAAKAIFERNYGENHIHSLDATNELGLLEIKTKQYAKAKKYLEHDIYSQKDVRMLQPKKIAVAKNHLAMIMVLTKKPDEALDFVNEAIHFFENQDEIDLRHYLSALNTASNIYYVNKNFRKAFENTEKVYNQIIDSENFAPQNKLAIFTNLFSFALFANEYNIIKTQYEKGYSIACSVEDDLRKLLLSICRIFVHLQADELQKGRVLLEAEFSSLEKFEPKIFTQHYIFIIFSFFCAKQQCLPIIERLSNTSKMEELFQKWWNCFKGNSGAVASVMKLFSRHLSNTQMKKIMKIIYKDYDKLPDEVLLQLESYTVNEIA